jgi:hypothetical protein
MRSFTIGMSIIPRREGCNVAGSIADPESKKPIYEVFRKAGTSDWRQAADPLLPITGLDSWDQVLEAIIR